MLQFIFYTNDPIITKIKWPILPFALFLRLLMLPECYHHVRMATSEKIP